MNHSTLFTAARILPGLALLAAFVVGSCDSYDPDVIPNDGVSVEKTQFYALSNSSTVIDLKTLVKAYTQVDLLIGQQPSQGSLTKLGAGLYAYMPQANLRSGRDYFMLDVRRGGKTVELDTIHIQIGQDTTQLPCGVYAVGDAVTIANPAAGQVIPIDVLANDHICGADTNDLTVSIFLGPPHGAVSTNGKSVVYTTSGYVGADTFLYEIQSAADTSIHAIGLVSLAVGIDACTPVLRRDDVQIDMDTLQSTVILTDVLQNDDLCDVANDVATITIPPRAGSASFATASVIAYTLPPLAAADFEDSLTYRVCRGAVCRTAVVRYTFTGFSCVVTALPDSVTMPAGSANPVTVQMLNNDTTCGSVVAVDIITAPKTGTVTINNNIMTYQPNSGSSPGDSLRYLLRDTSGGSSATWVKIKRQ